VVVLRCSFAWFTRCKRASESPRPCSLAPLIALIGRLDDLGSTISITRTTTALLASGARACIEPAALDFCGPCGLIICLRFWLVCPCSGGSASLCSLYGALIAQNGTVLPDKETQIPVQWAPVQNGSSKAAIGSHGVMTLQQLLGATDLQLKKPCECPKAPGVPRR
jgi:hypothetical protein